MESSAQGRTGPEEAEMNWRFKRSDDDKEGADLEKVSQGREVWGAEKTHDPGAGGRAMLPSEK